MASAGPAPAPAAGSGRSTCRRSGWTSRSGRACPGSSRPRALARVLRAALLAGGAPEPAAVGLVLADDAELARLNVAHMGHARPDRRPLVPAPPARGVPAARGRACPAARPGVGASARRAARPDVGPAFLLPPGARLHLGDIVVSVERAVEQAEAGRGGQAGDVRWSPADELRLLVVHGALHLCGWDHAEPAEEAAMRALEATILGAPAR